MRYLTEDWDGWGEWKSKDMTFMSKTYILYPKVIKNAPAHRVNAGVSIATGRKWEHIRNTFDGILRFKGLFYGKEIYA